MLTYNIQAVLEEILKENYGTAAGEVSLLVGQDNLSLFPVEKRRVGGAPLYGSWFGTGYIASSRPPGAKDDGGDRHAEVCTTVREEHEPKEATGCPGPPGKPPESSVCYDEQTATAGITFAQAIGGQGEAKACETPLPLGRGVRHTTTVEEDSQLDREVGQFLWDSDWEDDEDYRGLQRSYRSWEHGYGANSGRRAAAPVAACGATRVMPAMSATQVREEATQPVEATREATYLAMWADMRGRAVQGMLVHEKVAQVLSMSATQVHEEAARPAEAVRTATHSQTGRDIPKAKEDTPDWLP
jgi:hypothetical protein